MTADRLAQLRQWEADNRRKWDAAMAIANDPASSPNARDGFQRQAADCSTILVEIRHQLRELAE